MNHNKGFTLVELIITIGLLALIGTVLVVNMVGLNKRQEKTEKARIESSIKGAAEVYIDVNDEYKKDNTCIKVNNLVEQNYLKKSYITGYENSSIKVTKDDNGYKFDIYANNNNCN